MTEQTAEFDTCSLPGTKGFTLVELLVATAITLMLATILLSTTSGMLSAWNQSRGDLTSSNQAKLALDQIADDLQSVVLRNDGNVWFAASVTGTQPSSKGDARIDDASYSTTTGNRCKPATDNYDPEPDSGEIRDMRFGHVGTWLRFFLTERAANDRRDRISGVRAVSYQIAHVPEGTIVGSGRRYFLYRSSVRPGPYDGNNNLMSESSVTHSAFTTGYNIVDDNAYNNATKIGLQVSSDPLEPARIRRPIKSGIIASDVIDFGVRVYCRNSSGDLEERFPVNRSGGGTTHVFTLVATSSTSIPTIFGDVTAPAGVMAVVPDFPVVVEVMLRVLSDQGAQQIMALEENRIQPPGGSANYDAYWWEIAEAHSTIYTRRIEIPSTAFGSR